MLSNDDLSPKERMTDAEPCQHTIEGVFMGDGLAAPGWPLLALLLVLILR